MQPRCFRLPTSLRQLLSPLPTVAAACTVALGLLASGSHAQAAPVAFTVSSTASTIDLTASGQIFNSALTVTEQTLGSKAVRYFSPTTGSLLADVTPTGLEYTGGSKVQADVQRLLNVPIPLQPLATPANYAVSLDLPLGTPIALPTLPIAGFNVVSKITGFTTQVAMRNIELDFNSGVLSHSKGTPTTFDAADVDISFAAGTADISANVVWDIAGTTGGTITRALLVPALQALLPGISVKAGKAFGTDILIGFNLSQDLSIVGDLQNTPANNGTLTRSGLEYTLTTPVNIDVAAAVNELLADILQLDLNLKLSGNIVAKGSLPYVLGDATLDGIVDIADYTVWADNFLKTPTDWQEADFTGDGVVDIADYTIWADNFAPVVPVLSASAVPEPSSMVLSAMGLVCAGFYGWRRRRSA